METGMRNIVLAVDDSLLICNQISSALEEEPYFLCQAHTGAEALDMMEKYQPDLILLDVVLPDADGYELIQRLKQVDKNNASIIFLTSKDTDEDVVKGFSLGACDFIKKPFVKGELRSRVSVHMQMKIQKDVLNQRNQELQSTMYKLNEMAFKDGLTGLYNRRYVVGDLIEDIRESSSAEAVKSGEKKTVVVLADIDDFKNVNDTYGHDAGDAALICMANIMEEHCQEHRVIRWGGEEFLLVLFCVTEEEAFAISEEIRRDVEQFQIRNKEHQFSCTLTLGLHVHDSSERISDSIDKADEALYYGKRHGKNCSIWYKRIERAE